MNATEEKVKSANDYMAHKAMDNAPGRVQQATDGTAGRLRQGADQPSGMATAIGEKAHDVAAAVSGYAGAATQSVQHMAHSAADSMTHAKDAVAGWASGAAHHSGDYLKAGSDELTAVIRRYPVTTLLVAIGVGVILAKTIRV